MGIFNSIYKLVVKPAPPPETPHTEFMRLRLEIEDLASAGEADSQSVKTKRLRQKVLWHQLTDSEKEYHFEYSRDLFCCY